MTAQEILKRLAARYNIFQSINDHKTLDFQIIPHVMGQWLGEVVGRFIAKETRPMTGMCEIATSFRDVLCNDAIRREYKAERVVGFVYFTVVILRACLMVDEGNLKRRVT